MRIDKAFSWEYPLSVHGLMHNVITNAWRGDPYPIDTLLLFMANMAWNSSMNTSEVRKMLTDKDDGSRKYRDYPDFIVNYETSPGSGIGFLAGWRGKGGEKFLKGEPNPRQWEMYAKHDCLAMYHSWDSQNAWLRQIHGHNYLFVNPRVGAANGFDDGDWIRVESAHGKVRCMCRFSEAVEPGTVWTWNAIGKASGAWGLSAKADESSSTSACASTRPSPTSRRSPRLSSPPNPGYRVRRNAAASGKPMSQGGSGRHKGRHCAGKSGAPPRTAVGSRQ